MNKILLGTGIAALAVCTAALAEPGQRDGPLAGPMTLADMQAHAAQIFERMDANGDGKLDAADREARREQRFDRLDTNNDGSISREEFAAEPGWHGGHDGDRMGRRGHRGKGMMGNLADANNDGVVTKAEFEAATAQRFARMDADGDGTVTPEEHMAAHEAMRAKYRDMRQGQ